MNQLFNSAVRTAEPGGRAPSHKLELKPEMVAAENELLADAALLLATCAVASANGFSLQQQVAIWRPFR